MLKVTPETRQAFLRDSSHKEILIDFGGVALEDINYYIGRNYEHKEATTAQQLNKGDIYTVSSYPDFGGNVDHGSNMFNYVDKTYLNDFEYMYISFLAKLVFRSDVSPLDLKLRVYCGQGINYVWDYSVDQAVKILNSEERIKLAFRVKDLPSNPQFMMQFITNVLVNESATKVNYRIEASDVMLNLSHVNPNEYVYQEYVPTQIIDGKYPQIADIDPIKNKNIVSESFRLTESLCSQENLKFGLCEASHMTFTVADRKEDFKNKKFKAYIKADGTEDIPLGEFKVRTVSKQINHNLITKKVTAYDAMETWSADATAWYSRYMYAINMEQDPQMPASYKKPWLGKADIDFTRQMLSTYFNFALKNGFEKREDYPYDVYDLVYVASDSTGTEMLGYTVSVGDVIEKNNIKMTSYYTPYENIYENPDTSKLYFCKPNILSGMTEQEVLKYYSFNSDSRGLINEASIMICEELSDGTFNKFLVDAEDYFCLSANCVKLHICYGYKIDWWTSKWGTTGRVVNSLYVYAVDMKPWQAELINRSTRLVYYDWKKTLYGEDDHSYSIECTQRDVLRSLFEINGAFCRINRFGNFEVLYAQKEGLYPSENLYPSNDLFPIKGIDRIARSKYMVATAEDYISQDFGQIQIVSQNTDEGAVAIKTYVGNPDLDSTYIIDDNIFYSNSLVRFNEYYVGGDVAAEHYDPIPEVETMLKNLYIRIKSTSYTPHETKALGMPWMEVGDRINLITSQDAFESFIFNRTLKGTQFLQDTYEARGNDIIRAYKEN